MATASSSNLRVRVVANRVNGKILFMETDQAFVNVLLCFLQLPLAIMFRILATGNSRVPQVGCISNAYQSLCNLLKQDQWHPSSSVPDPSGLPYVITDDLNILQISNTMESLELLSKLKVTSMAKLRKLETSISEKEVLELFKCSLSSNVALNLVFGSKVNYNLQESDSMLCRTQLVKVDTSSVSVRFLVKRHTQKILYMEVGKDFINLLESFLNTPVAWLMKKLSQGDVNSVLKVGSMSNVFKSVYKLSKDIFLVPIKDIVDANSNKARASPNVLISLLRAAAASVYACSKLHTVSFLCNDTCHVCKDDMTIELAIINQDSLPVMGRHVYKCSRSIERCACVSYARLKLCTSCGDFTNREIPIVFGGIANATLAPVEGFRGYVRDGLSFIVTDDLDILPASSFNSIDLLNKAKASRMEKIHSLEVCVTITEALELLKAAFTSKEALNMVFGDQIDRRMSQSSWLDCECVDFLLHWWNSHIRSVRLLLLSSLRSHI